MTGLTTGRFECVIIRHAAFQEDAPHDTGHQKFVCNQFGDLLFFESFRLRTDPEIVNPVLLPFLRMPPDQVTQSFGRGGFILRVSENILPPELPDHSSDDLFLYGIGHIRLIPDVVVKKIRIAPKEIRIVIEHIIIVENVVVVKRRSHL